jgi:hypothetical protein
MKCDICGMLCKVNGQHGIEVFVKLHQHKQTDLQLKINPDVTRDNPQDRIDLKIDPTPLITHGKYYTDCIHLK